MDGLDRLKDAMGTALSHAAAAELMHDAIGATVDAVAEHTAFLGWEPEEVEPHVDRVKALLKEETDRALGAATSELARLMSGPSTSKYGRQCFVARFSEIGTLVAERFDKEFRPESGKRPIRAMEVPGVPVFSAEDAVPIIGTILEIVSKSVSQRRDDRDGKTAAA